MAAVTLQPIVLSLLAVLLILVFTGVQARSGGTARIDLRGVFATFGLTYAFMCSVAICAAIANDIGWGVVEQDLATGTGRLRVAAIHATTAVAILVLFAIGATVAFSATLLFTGSADRLASIEQLPSLTLRLLLATLVLATSAAVAAYTLRNTAHAIVAWLTYTLLLESALTGGLGDHIEKRAPVRSAVNLLDASSSLQTSELLWVLALCVLFTGTSLVVLRRTDFAA